jgi:hypothetical protein
MPKRRLNGPHWLFELHVFLQQFGNELGLLKEWPFKEVNPGMAICSSPE